MDWLSSWSWEKLALILGVSLLLKLELSLGLLAFLIVYSVALIGIFLYFVWLRYPVTTGISSHESTALIRIQSQLTFLPLLHFIRTNGLKCKSLLEKHCRRTKTGEMRDEGQITQEENENATSILQEQRDILIHAILKGYIFPWYNRISDEKSFPIHAKQILQTAFNRFDRKLRQVDRTVLAQEAIQIIHSHWKEYCEAVDRVRSDDKGTSSLPQTFRLSHPFVQNKEELSTHYQNLICLLLQQLVLPDLQSELLCKFLSGILAKSCVLYCIDIISQPSWLNRSLVASLSIGGLPLNPNNLNPPTAHSDNKYSFPSTPQQSESDSEQSATSFFQFLNKSHNQASHTPSDTDESPVIILEQSPSAPSLDSSKEPGLEGTKSSCDNTNPSAGRSVSAALGGILSATAFPLLPQECHRLPPPIKSHDETETSTNKKEMSHVPSAASEKGDYSTVVQGTMTASGIATANLVATAAVVTAAAKPSEPCPGESSSINMKDGLEQEKADLIDSSNDGPCMQNDNIQKVEETKLECENESVPGCQDTLRGEEEDRNEIGQDDDIDDHSQSEECRSGRDSPCATKPRFHSFDSAVQSTNTKGSCAIEKNVTKSLDETKKTQVIVRQEEIDWTTPADSLISPAGRIPVVNGTHESPVYEEPEDFAATIAKLRSLLEQRQSRQDLLEKTPDNDVSTNHPVSTTTPAIPSSTGAGRPVSPKPRYALYSYSSASSIGSDASGSSISQTSIDAEKMTLEKTFSSGSDVSEGNGGTGLSQCTFFRNVMITKAESFSDLNGNFTFYCIQYEGVYPEEQPVGNGSEEPRRKLILRTTTIKRRFKEFLLLQSQLEESPVWKPYLKGIKAPNKWLNLTFTKVDTNVVNQRRALLERYLHQLCYHPVLGFSSELRQFMAYGEEGFQIFGPDDFSPHGLDKLARKFAGVINSLRDALPSFETELLSVPSSPDAFDKSPSSESKGKKLLMSFLHFGEKSCNDGVRVSSAGPPSPAVHNEGTMEESLKSAEWPFRRNSNAGKENKINDGEKQELCLQHNVQPKNNPEAEIKDEESGLLCESKMPSSDSIQDDSTESASATETLYPVASALTQLLCDVIWLPNHRPNTTSISAFMSISGKSFENYAQELLEVFLSEDAFITYTQWLTTAVTAWEDNLDESSSDQYSLSFSETDLRMCLKRRVPVWMRWMWGRTRVDMTIERMTGFCQDSILNQDLILSLAELLFSKLIDMSDYTNPTS